MRAAVSSAAPIRAACACVLLSLTLVACGASSATRPELVVWIEVDTLRVDHLGCYGGQATPALDRFAQEGVVFERAYATAPWTLPSLASQLTGLYPWEHGLLRLRTQLDPSHVTVAERFRSAGWRTAGLTTNFVASSYEGFDQGFERWDEELASGHEGASGAEAAQRVLAQIDELRDQPSEGVFAFALLFEPHWRYLPDEAGGPAPDTIRVEEGLPELRARLGELSAADIEFLRHSYRAEVQRVDAAFASLRAGLEARGLWEDALVVFTADHGEELMERGWLGHTRTLHDELVRVPLIVKCPGAPAGERRSAPVSQVDLEASVRAWAGLAPESSGFAPVLTGGAAMRQQLYLHSDFEPFLDTSSAAAKRTLQWGVYDVPSGRKWIVDHLPADGGAPRGELYELDRDPEELHDRAGELDARDLWLRPELEASPHDG